MRNAPRKSVLKFRHSFTTNVTTATWVELISSLGQPATFVEIFNSSGSVLKLSTGAAAAEDASELPYYVLPNGSNIMLPWNVAKATRISAKAVDADATTGALILNFFD